MCVCVCVSMCSHIPAVSPCNGPLWNAVTWAWWFSSDHRIVWVAAEKGVGENVLALHYFFWCACKLRRSGALNISKGENAPLEGTKQSLCSLVHMCWDKMKQHPHYNCIRGCILRRYKEAEKALKAPANFFFFFSNGTVSGASHSLLWELKNIFKNMVFPRREGLAQFFQDSHISFKESKLQNVLQTQRRWRWTTQVSGLFSKETLSSRFAATTATT